MMEYHKLKHAREDGIEQGAKETKVEMAQKMLEKNLELSLISECTGLSIEEIKKLKSD